MAPRTTTGITLTLEHKTSTYTLTRPGSVLTIAPTLGREPTLNDCSVAAALGSGYWLRKSQDAATTTWTWVEL